MMAKNAKLETWFALFAVLMMVPLDAQAQATHSISVGGAGREPCSSWTQDRQGTSPQSKVNNERRIEWVSGFFTAVNLYTEPSGNLHGGIDDQKGMLGSLDTYCKAKPADPLFAAAAGLALDLKNHPRH